jgi:putative DNA primase/helicase
MSCLKTIQPGHPQDSRDTRGVIVVAVEVNPEPIPDELKERDQWLLWDASNDVPRRPHWRGDFSVSWSDPDDWHTFEDALAAAEEVESWGIGYVMAKDNDSHPHGLYGCLDLDGCLEAPESPKDWLPSLRDFIDDGAYIERSPSGDGLHIPLVGQDRPEWWSDFTDDDEHEGVEYLTNKFCTFTGDLLGDGHEGVGSADPTDFLFRAYTELEGEGPRVEPSDSAAEHDSGDVDLDKSDIEDALDHISSSCGYPKWRDIAFAVHDWDSGSTGKSVFESWSRGSGWDDQSQRYIDAIWESAEQGSGVTVGTLIHHAKEGGWSPPSANRDAYTRAEESEDAPDPGQTTSWEDVRQLYELAQESQDIDKGPARQAAEDQLLNETDWMHVNESEQLWVYDDETGTYGKYGEAEIGQRLKEELGPYYAISEKNEIADRIKEGNRVFRRELNARQHDGALLCVGNGVVNFDTGELLDHDPEYRFVRGLDTDYPTDENGLEADRDRVLEFLDDITQRTADRDTLLDHLAHGLMPGHPYRAFVVTFGPGGNGKTQLAQLFTGFVGDDNAASVEIDELVNDDFATGDLPGKFLNWGDDMSGDGGGTLKELSTLKKASGGSSIRANEKYEKTFDFQNQAALFFSANEPPRLGEVKPSIKDRLYPIQMPYRFVSDPDPDDEMEKEKVPKVAETLLEDDAAMRGLLLLAVEHGQRLRENRGEYSMPESPDERFKLYNREADPIVRFSRTAVEPAGPSLMIRKDDVYRVYQSMMDAWQERAAGERGFKRQFPSTATEDVETARSRALATEDDDERVRCWKRIQWTSEATQFMPDWMKERYSAHFDEEDGKNQSPDSTEDDTETTALGARDVGHGQSFTAEVAAVSAGEYTREAQGQFKGPHGTYISFVVPGDNENPLDGRQGETLHFEGVTLRTDDDGLLEAVINDAVEVTAIDSSQSGLDSHDTGPAAADGGRVDEDRPEGSKAAVRDRLTTHYETNDTVTVGQLAGEVELSPAEVESALGRLAEQGAVQQEGDKEYRLT